MKFLHISDLHIGKRLNDFPMTEDQIHILNEILRIAAEEAPNAVLIAGDVYDKSIPSAEAVTAFDDFLSRLHQMDIPVCIISGNHDSPERLAFGARVMHSRGIYISRVYDGMVASVRLEDCHGTVSIYMLPFIKPAHIRRFYPEASIESYTDAVRTALSDIAPSPDERRILLAHQFVAGAQTSDSEELSVGGIENVDASVFDGFDYVALGHLHSPQKAARDTIRYCGSPLKYSFSERGQTKSVTVINMQAKGDVHISTIPLTPLRDLKAIKGSYMELTAKAYYTGTTLPEDYLHITLTDELDVPEAMGKLRTIYRNLMKLSYDNTRTRTMPDTGGAAADVRPLSPIEVFASFYEMQNGMPMSAEQEALVRRLAEESAEQGGAS